MTPPHGTSQIGERSARWASGKNMENRSYSKELEEFFDIIDANKDVLIRLKNR